MALEIRNLLNSSSTCDGCTSSSPATLPSSLAFGPSPRESSCPQSPNTPTDLSDRVSAQVLPAKRFLEDRTINQYTNPGPPIAASTGPPSAMPHPTLPTTYTPCRPQQLPAHLQASHPPNTQASWPPPSPPSETPSSWSEALQKPDYWRSSSVVEEQQAFIKLPGSNAPIPVHMDYLRASKKADEKRQRNAVASTRHRRKKKIRQEENSKQLKELRDERIMMEIRIDELTQQRDFYQEDRNRLRRFILQTLSTNLPAGGPPSPSFSTSNSHVDTGLLASWPSGSIGYGGDMISSERPTQRRRTDDHPEYSLPRYGSPANGRQSAFPSGPHPRMTQQYPLHQQQVARGCHR